MSNFVVELRELLNKHSKENGSYTPDFVLAIYLRDCLDTFNRAVLARDGYYDFGPTRRKRESTVLDNTTDSL